MDLWVCTRHKLLGICVPRCCGPTLLPHAVEMMDGSGPAAQGMSIGDCGGDVGFGEKSGFGEASVERQVAGHGGGEGAAGTVGGVRALAFRFEDFVLQAASGREGQEICGFLE